MANPDNRIVIPLIMLALLYILSILFFHYVEGWSFLDAAYYTTVTIATVGYGDFTPKSPFGKIGAMVLIFGGVSLALYVITHLGTWREKTLDKKIKDRIDLLRNLAYIHSPDAKKEELKRNLKTKLHLSKEAAKEAVKDAAKDNDKENEDSEE